MLAHLLAYAPAKAVEHYHFAQQIEKANGQQLHFFVASIFILFRSGPLSALPASGFQTFVPSRVFQRQQRANPFSFRLACTPSNQACNGMVVQSFVFL